MAKKKRSTSFDQKNRKTAKRLVDNPVPSLGHEINSGKDAGLFLLGIVWQEFGEPIIRKGLRKLSERIVDRIDNPSTVKGQLLPSKDSEIIMSR